MKAEVWQKIDSIFQIISFTAVSITNEVAAENSTENIRKSGKIKLKLSETICCFAALGAQSL